MNFNSIEFLIFLPIVVLTYWITPYKHRWAPLLFASYYFYMSWNASLVVLIAGITLISYISGRIIGKSQNDIVKKVWLVFALSASLGLLLYFKYFNFIAENLSNLFTGSSDYVFLDIILPIGISFYTFQALSYVIDVYRKTIKPEGHLGYYALFVSFFPQLVAGPIERPQNLLPQLKTNNKIKSEDLHQGLRFLISGFFKKIVIADFVSTFVNAVYSQTGAVDGGAIFIATILFSIQIYCDFSGYSDIALGSSRLMGIRLMKNFDRPYLSQSIREFWRRWHISLSSWFSDYVYKPMGGSKKGLPKQIIAVIVVFIISGLWHGAAWTFVIWGLIHALFMVTEIFMQKIKSRYDLPELFNNKKLKKALSIIITYSLVSFSWIFFRAESLPKALYYIGRLFTLWNFKNAVSLLGVSLLDVLQLGLILSFLPFLNKLADLPARQKATKLGTNKLAVTYVFFIMVIGFSWLIQLQQNTSNIFIYFQF